MEYIAMRPFQQRVVDEFEALHERLGKLNSFVGTETFYRLPQNEQVRMLRQRGFMQDYAEVLAERIAAFK